MAAERRFEVRVTSAAPADELYALLADAPSWRRWAGPMVTRSGWEVEPVANRSGGVRRLGRPPWMVREEILLADPPSRHAYRLLSGQPVRSYRAEVRLVELDPTPGAAGGTRIEWSGTVVPMVPGTGRLMAALLGRMVTGFARRLAETDERP